MHNTKQKMKSFLQSLNYSASNEDSGSEIKALHIRDTDSVLCITGSGSRTLDLLTQRPSHIVSIDIAPCQNFLLELKVTAMNHLEYEEFLEFLGVYPSRQRIRTYKNIRKSLPHEAKWFWDTHISMIERGIIYQGKWEKYFAKLALLCRIERPNHFAKLFKCRDLEEQAVAWSKWNNVLWRFFLRLISLRAAWKYAFGDPAFFLNVPTNFSIYEYLENQLACAAKNILFNKSPFVQLLFYGRYDPNQVLPIYLQKEHYRTLQSNCENIKIVTQSLVKYLAQPAIMKFDKFSLSDFSSYTSMEEYRRIWQGIIRIASKEAYICERQFLVKRELPIEVEPYVTRNTTLEKHLRITDNSIFYSFTVVTIDRNHHGEH